MDLKSEAVFNPREARRPGLEVGCEWPFRILAGIEYLARLCFDYLKRNKYQLY